jgi:hypothetical protein
VRSLVFLPVPVRAVTLEGFMGHRTYQRSCSDLQGEESLLGVDVAGILTD